MSSLRCDIVLLPALELAGKAIEASNAVRQYDNFFTLEDGKFYPHMSLYMFQLNESNVSKAEEVLAKIAEDTKAVFSKAKTYGLGAGFDVGYVDAEFEVTEELNRLQDRVISAINPIRAGMRERYVNKMQDAEGLKSKNLQKYGYSAVGDLFRPHITLTRLKVHNPKVLELLPQDVRSFSGTFNRLGLFEMGENGTCIRNIAELPLL